MAPHSLLHFVSNCLQVPEAGGEQSGVRREAQEQLAIGAGGRGAARAPFPWHPAASRAALPVRSLMAPSARAALGRGRLHEL